MTNEPTKNTLVAGSDYVLSFYTDLMTLNGLFADYCNLINVLQNMPEAEKIDEDHQNFLIELTNKVRYYVILTNIKHVAMCNNLKKDLKDAQEKSSTILTQKVIKVDSLREYVNYLNSFVIDDVVQDLMASANKTITAVYGAK